MIKAHMTNEETVDSKDERKEQIVKYLKEKERASVHVQSFFLRIKNVELKEEIINDLIQEGLSPLTTNKCEGQSALHYAAKYASSKIFEILLNSVNKIDFKSVIDIKNGIMI